MSLRKLIKTYALLVVDDVMAGRHTAYSEEATEFLDRTPEAILELPELIRREVNRKLPDEALLEAYLYMFRHGLTLLRFETERGRAWAEEHADEVRQILLKQARARSVGAGMLMLLINAFHEAKLDPGAPLTQAVEQFAVASAGDDAELPPDLEALLDEMVTEAGKDAFAVHAALTSLSQAMPAKFGEAVLPNLAVGPNAVVRDAAVLFLLDPSPALRKVVCAMLAEHTPPTLLSAEALRRMIAVRNWLPADERPLLDAAIKRARQAGVECASQPSVDIEQILVSHIDGADAMSIFAVTKQERERRIDFLLLKGGVGIADAWNLRERSRAKAKEIVDRLHEEMELIAVDMPFLHRLLGHYLAVGLRQGTAPPAGFLDFVEAIAMDGCQPREVSARDLIDLIEKELRPNQLSAAAVERAMESSAAWLDVFEFLESWFEDDAEVQRLLAAKAEAGENARAAAVLESILEPRRSKWTSRLLWTALWLRQEQDLLEAWSGFFNVGRELHRGRPMAEIPFMRSVAEVTVEANFPGRS